MAPVDFPPTSFAEWRTAAIGAHDDAWFDRRLTTEIDGELRVQPLYTRENARSDTTAAGRPDARRWIVCLEVDIRNAETARLIGDADALGASGLWLRAATVANVHDFVSATIDTATHASDPLWIDVDTPVAGDVVAAAALTRDRVAGGLVLDPIAAGNPGSVAPDASRDAACDILADILAGASHAAPGVRTLWADLRAVHAAGADAVTELAVAAASAVDSIDAMRLRGHDIDGIAPRVAVVLDAPDDLFTGIAMIRALRAIWARILGAYGARAHHALFVHARTSARVETQRDHWNNLLRGTLGAFAMGVGGADAVTVRPFDCDRRASSRFGHRLAINTQRILLDESHLADVADPARGSWYVESLTFSLARAGWDAFREIARHGDLSRAIAGGWVRRRIDAHVVAQERQVAKRLAPIVGVSLFAPTPGERDHVAPGERDHVAPGELDHAAAAHRAVTDANPRTGADDGVVDPETCVRWATPFEALQDAADAHTERTGTRPAIPLVALGPPRAHRDRVAFVTDVLAAGGIVVAATHALADDDPVGALDVTAIANVGAVIVCGSDETYLQRLPDVARHLGSNGVGEIVVAGRMPTDASRAWSAAGVTGSVYLGADIVAFLRTLADAIGVARDGGTG